MTTRERIVDESLTLFSRKGYSGVSVKEIAGAVGIRDSSLYKHFKSKQEIFDTILAEMTRRMDHLTEQFSLSPGMKNNDAFFASLDADALVSLSKQVFLFYLEEPFAARFRRMLTVEQFHDSVVADLYRKIFTEDSIIYQSEIFKKLIANGVIRPADPTLLALHFYAPIFLLILHCDQRSEEKPEALDLVERHVREFLRIYGGAALPSPKRSL